MFTVQGIEIKRLVASCDGVVHVSGNLIRLKKLCSDLLPPLTQRKVKKKRNPKLFVPFSNYSKKFYAGFLKLLTQQTFACRKSAIETLEKVLKNNKDTRMTFLSVSFLYPVETSENIGLQIIDSYKEKYSRMDQVNFVVDSL